MILLMTTTRSSKLRLMTYSKKYKLRNETVLLHINESGIFPRNISRIYHLRNFRGAALTQRLRLYRQDGGGRFHIQIPNHSEIFIKSILIITEMDSFIGPLVRETAFN